MSRGAATRMSIGCRRAIAWAWVAAVVLALAAPARADTPPTVWDRARDPVLAANYDLHVEVQRRLAARERFDVRDAQVRAVRALLDAADVEHRGDLRLRLDLATVEFLLQNYERARTLFQAALAEAPNHPAAEEAWLRLAFTCGHLGDHACERRSYAEVLRRTTEEPLRATPLLNLAETEMHLGHLREALDGYREALRISGGHLHSVQTSALATWGLAVALDRSGDRVAAEKNARFAIELQHTLPDPNILHSQDVFFVPAYEVHYYDGLGAAAQARATTSPREALPLWRAAERAFGAFVQAADGKGDRWLPIARVRLAQARSERERIERKVAKEPTPEVADEALDF